MTIRDLGYRPYEGVRLPPSNNTKVLLRYGLRRAWGSWLVKLATFFGWFPCVIGWAAIGIHFTQQGSGAAPYDGAAWTARLLLVQLWCFVTLVTLGAGAGAISEDLTHRAFPFFFAKPVTPAQYLVGRTSAIALYCFVLCFVPATLLILAMVGTSPAELRLERLGLLAPALLESGIIAIVTAAASVAASSLSKSRALTMSAWILIFIVPHVLASLVDAIGDFPWLRLASLPALFEIVGDGLFKIQAEGEGELRWFHALPILTLMTAGSLLFAHQRLRRAEVVA